jgi:hypothetical protein
MNLKTPLLIFGLAILIYGCRREEKVWENNILAPIFEADMSLDDLLRDSILTSNNDNSYRLTYQYTTEIDSIGSYLTVPDTIDTVNVKLQSLILDNRELTDTFTLREMDPASGLIDGLTVPLDAYDLVDAGGEQEIDVSEAFFQTAKFIEGYLDITLHNDLPVYVDLMIFQLTNKNDGSIVVKDTFLDIPEFSSKTKTISLAGKQVNGVMIGKVLRVKTRASTGPVLVDADKGVRIEMNIRDLKPEYATAIFPAQTLVTDTQEVTYRFGGPRITVMKARSGFVKMKIFSTIEEEIVIDYSFPFSGENGDFTKPFSRQYRVPAATPGTTQKIEASFPLDGFMLHYQGKDPDNAPFTNTVYSKLTARTVYSGKVRNLSLDDSVYIEFGLVDIVPEFAIGDFGSKTFKVDEPIDVKALKNVFGSIDLQDVELTLTFDNGFGIEALTTVNSIEAQNARSGESVSLTHPNLINKDVLIKRAINPPFTSRKHFYFFDQNNSNVESFLETLPDQIIPNITVVTRPNGSNDFQDFVFYDSYLKAHLRLEMPVTFAMDNLQFVRKKAFTFADIANSEKIKSGKFKLQVDNDFPLDVKLNLEFLSEDENVLLEVFKTDNTIEAATIPTGMEMTDMSVRSYLIAELSEAQIDLIRDSKKIRIKATFDTPGNDRTKIFNTYQIKTKLIGDFVYEQSL